VALANTVLFATLPALPLPIAYAELAYQVIETGLVDLNSARLAFRPRGPPIS